MKMKNVLSTASRRRIVTIELMRKRAEHNEGLVSDLEELALHQEDLEGIGPILGRTCGKTLKILLLQNNIISSLPYSEMKFFKSLVYLNLALNNISIIEERSLSGCESLEKLDLTLNFLNVKALPLLVSNLAEIKSFRELYMVGNPCMGTAAPNDDLDHEKQWDESDDYEESDEQKTISGWKYCSKYIIAKLPQLEKLDGRIISRSERIKARQRLPEMEKDLAKLMACDGIIQVENEVSNSGTIHSPACRVQMSDESVTRKIEKEKRAKANQPHYKGEAEWEYDQKLAVEREREREQAGILRQCNGMLLRPLLNFMFGCVDKIHNKNCLYLILEGKWNFTFDEESNPGHLLLKVCLPRHLSSTLIDLDVHPTYVSAVIKSKVLKLVLPAEVKSESSVAQRSSATGHLVVTMPKVNPRENYLSPSCTVREEPSKRKLEARTPWARQMMEETNSCVNVKSIVNRPDLSKDQEQHIVEIITHRKEASESNHCKNEINRISIDSDSDEPPDYV